MVKNHSQKLRATIMEKSIPLRFNHILILSQDTIASIVDESNIYAKYPYCGHVYIICDDLRYKTW